MAHFILVYQELDDSFQHSLVLPFADRRAGEHGRVRGPGGGAGGVVDARVLGAGRLGPRVDEHGAKPLAALHRRAHRRCHDGDAFVLRRMEDSVMRPK